MVKSILRLGIPSTLVFGSVIALGVSSTACSSSSSGGSGSDGDAATDSGAGGSNTGGSSSTGGASSGGSGNGSGGTGGSNAGDSGTGGAATGGATGTGGGTDGGDGCVADPLVPPTVPDAIKTPDGTTLIHRFRATGSQIYTCTGTAVSDGGMSYSWVLKAPDAILAEDCVGNVATHFAGPTWKSDADGSTVVGTKLAAANGTSDHVPWLLLQATSNTGSGIFSEVTYVQRVDTTGGVAPASGCEAATVDTEQNVPYTATYYFYTGPVADGG